MKAIRFRCPKCRAEHSAPARLAGQPVLCKGCSDPLVVPEGAEIPSPEVPTEAAIPAPVPVEARPRSRPIGRLAVRAAAAFVLVATVGVLVGLYRGNDQRPGVSKTVAVVTQEPVEEEELLTSLEQRIEPQPEPEAKPQVVVTLPAPEVPTVEPPAPVVASPAPAPASRNDPDRPLLIRRRQILDQDTLRRQLAELPEMTATDKTESALIALHHVALPARHHFAQSAQGVPQGRRAIQEVRGNGRGQVAAGPIEHPTKPAMHVARDEGAPHDLLAMIQHKQPELATLPWRMGNECHLGRETAEDLQVLSRALRTVLAQMTTQGDTRPDADRLRSSLLGSSKFLVPAAIPALQQLLMAERTPVRLVLVEVLNKIDCPDAAKALTRLAIFDLAPEVRERAMMALRSRKPETYRPSLLEGFRYPWAPVADHAAEALVALGDREAVSDLVALLDQPDPSRPRTEIRDGKSVTLTRSLVQVNHLQNCVLCHAPSGDETIDLVRGRVPDESKPLPPPIEYYGNTSPGLFVRAEVTYLRQDFSVTQPVADHGPWPAYQRYDYLVTETPISRWSQTVSSGDKDEYPQRDSVLFALRELTGQNLGPRSLDWKAKIEVMPTRPPSE